MATKTSLLKELIFWALGRRERYIANGDSMTPTIRSGDSLLIDDHHYKQKKPQIGDIVLAKHPHDSGRILVKRIVKLNNEDIYLQGDNPLKSTDSREFGPIGFNHLLAKVTCWF